MRASFMAFLSGVLFAAGLVLGGMTDPANVQGFLDVTGEWDFRLAFVMGGAVAVHAALRPWVLRRSRPVFAARFPPPPPDRVDARLVWGAALFGVGWGLGGYCPGPALTSLTRGALAPGVFVLAMLVGMVLARWVTAGRSARGASARRDAAPAS